MERQSMLSAGLFIYTNKNFFKCYWQPIFFFHILLLHVFFHVSTAVFFKLKRKSPLYIKAITPCFTYTLQMFSMLFVFKFLLWCKHILHMIVNKSIHFFLYCSCLFLTATENYSLYNLFLFLNVLVQSLDD